MRETVAANRFDQKNINLKKKGYMANEKKERKCMYLKNRNNNIL